MAKIGNVTLFSRYLLYLSYFIKDAAGDCICTNKIAAAFAFEEHVSVIHVCIDIQVDIQSMTLYLGKMLCNPHVLFYMLRVWCYHQLSFHFRRATLVIT
jgi:hypothetical protein